MDALAGKVAVVTGAASGIGLGLCERFADEGMRIVMADVDAARLDAAAEQLAARADLLAVRTDASRWEDVAELARRAHDRFGAVHVLCNNAGVTRPGVTWEHTLEDWDWVLGVNLRGVIHGIRAFVPAMIERDEPAHVVNTASIGGLVAFPGITIYTASKYAVVGLSEGLLHDLREAGAPVGVSVLCPGPTATLFREHSRQLGPGPTNGEPAPANTGLPAAEVAAQTVDAIRGDRFWILTHPEYRETIEERHRSLVEGGDAVAAAVLG
jgi:NAD(P)-dependent dehydrogenase (short-subunit alcohol dehydrogenase family)